MIAEKYNEEFVHIVFSSIRLSFKTECAIKTISLINVSN